jgi:hypothetical protein
MKEGRWASRLQARSAAGPAGEVGDAPFWRRPLLAVLDVGARLVRVDADCAPVVRHLEAVAALLEGQGSGSISDAEATSGQSPSPHLALPAQVACGTFAESKYGTGRQRASSRSELDKAVRTCSPRLARVVARLERDRPAVGVLAAIEVVVVFVLILVKVVLVLVVVLGQPVGHAALRFEQV